MAKWIAGFRYRYDCEEFIKLKLSMKSEIKGKNEEEKRR